MSTFQKILVLRSSSSEGHILWTCKLDCKPKELPQEILELVLSTVFPNITLSLRIFCQFACINSFRRTQFQCVETG
jgi:hypothetical protein